MRTLVLLLVALASLPLFAQTSLDLGVAVGQQSYADTIDDPRILTGAEALVRRGNAGLHVALEYADLSEEGALLVLHPDLVYRWPLGSFGLTAGAGATYAYIDGPEGGLTWNAEVELDRRFGRATVFGRVRHYDYELPRRFGFDAGPTGPAVYVGVRFNVAGR